MQTHSGELAALGTAVCLTITAIAFESAGKKVGSLAVNYIRLFVAFMALIVCTFFTRGMALPLDADGPTWFWLLISGLIGFVIGDTFLFQALVEIGSRITLLILSAAPPITALLGFIVLGERILPLGLAGMFITMAGICLVILSRNPAEKRLQFNRPIRGIVFACIGALGQALGLVFSKMGIGAYNILAATQIRLIAAFIGFTVMITVRYKWPEIKDAFKDRGALLSIILGAVFGPFIGVTLSLAAVKYTATGIVSSISSISPIIIIPVAIIIFKERVLPKEVWGALITVAGITLLFL